MSMLHPTPVLVSLVMRCIRDRRNNRERYKRNPESGCNAVLRELLDECHEAFLIGREFKRAPEIFERPLNGPLP